MLLSSCLIFSSLCKKKYFAKEWQWNTAGFFLSLSLNDLAAEWKAALQSQGWKSGQL